MIARMMSCYWARRRVHAYLDADPALPLSPQDVERLERHLRVCARCSRTVEETRRLRAALDRLAQRRDVDPEAISRLRSVGQRLASGELS